MFLFQTDVQQLEARRERVKNKTGTMMEEEHKVGFVFLAFVVGVPQKFFLLESLLVTSKIFFK